MKKQILNLGKALDKKAQKEVSGGITIRECFSACGRTGGIISGGRCVCF